MAEIEAPNRVRERWKKHMAAVCGWMTTSSPLVAQTLAAAGFDAVIIDMQHSATTLDDVVGLASAIELNGAEPFVRMLSLDPALIGKLVDLGITGIIVPMVESRSAAEELAAAVRYPPDGCRSFGPRRPMVRFGANYQVIAPETVVTLAMIETAKGFERLEEIASVEGLDGLFVGPADLAIAIEQAPGSSDPSIEAAIASIRDRSWRLNCRAGIFSRNVQTAAQRLEQGFDLVTATADLTAVSDRAAQDAKLLAARCMAPKDEAGQPH